MTMAATVQAYLDQHRAGYEIVPHSPADTSSMRAQAAHVPGAQLAKAVVVEHSDRFAVVVVPAMEHVHLGELRKIFGDTYALATEDRLAQVFPDCDPGSVPPFGQAYGLDVLVDDALLSLERVYAECGDRAALVRVSGDDFRRLMQDVQHGDYSHVPAHEPHPAGT